jgi:hypothetical protein
MQAAEKTIKAAWSYLTQMAEVHSTMLLAVEDYVSNYIKLCIIIVLQYKDYTYAT